MEAALAAAMQAPQCRDEKSAEDETKLYGTHSKEEKLYIICKRQKIPKFRIDSESL